MTRFEAFLNRQLAQIRAADRYRVRRVVDGGHGVRLRVDGRDCVNFCSNDYLGLAGDPRIAAAARRALDDTGTGSGAAALVSGYNRHHRELEQAIAEFTGRERALLFSSGWAANLGVIRALLGRDSTVIADELNHASLIDGGRLSGARYRRVRHADAEDFAAALDELPAPAAGASRPAKSIPALVVTDSVFSMDGDLAPLPALAAQCREHDVPLMVDDAHGFGVLGSTGRGAFEHFAMPTGPRSPVPDIQVATLGKAAGCAGAFVAGDQALIEFLIQRARSWVFSTAPPPAIAAAATEALRIMATEAEHRERLHQHIAQFRRGAAERGIAVGPRSPVPGPSDFPEGPRSPVPGPGTPTPIQPLVIGAEAPAMAISENLQRAGFWVAAIRPPTVPAGTARLRITLSAAHTEAQIDALLDALATALSASQAVAS